MIEQAMINQEAQDHAAACALFARLLGQLAPAFMRLPVLHKYLDEPTQCMALDNIKRAPGQVRCHQITIGLFALVFDCDDESFGAVGADVHPCTADMRYHLFTASDTDGLWRTRMRGKIVRHVLVVLIHADFLIATYLRDHLHATE